MFVYRGEGNQLREKPPVAQRGGLWSADSEDLRLRGNNIVGNKIGLLAYGSSSSLVDARKNWWGHVTGPWDLEGNPAGGGDAVWGDVEYRPWPLEPNEDAGP